jgi:putative transposase
MGSTHTAILLHVVFATRDRRPWMTDGMRPRVFEYFGGAVRGQGGVAAAIGGMPDHVHLLVRWRADEALSTLMREIKAQSSRWVHETFPACAEFAWQEGYAAFSVSPSQSARAKRYIENQEEHHRVRDFRQELTALLGAHGVDFDERYL